MKLRGIKPTKKTLTIAGGAGLVLVLGTTAAAFAFSGLGVKGKLEKAFPQADIMAVDCSAGPAGLCEVIAGGGKNVFYASRDGRFALVGSVLDLETKKDVTDQRLRDLAAMNAGAARISGPAASVPQETGTAAPVGQAPAGQKVSLSGLPSPASNAIVHNPGAATKMVVFTDLNWGRFRLRAK
jgi:thiol:disulfide interchange protein DsbC